MMTFMLIVTASMRLETLEFQYGKPGGWSKLFDHNDIAAVVWDLQIWTLKDESIRNVSSIEISKHDLFRIVLGGRQIYIGVFIESTHSGGHRLLPSLPVTNQRFFNSSGRFGIKAALDGPEIRFDHRLLSFLEQSGLLVQYPDRRLQH